MCRLTGCSVYDGIVFHGNVGKLTLSNEKILFQQTEDLSAAPRTWLWQSMKRVQINDGPDGKHIIKIRNHQNKAVSFLVPDSALSSIQEDIDARMNKEDVSDHSEADVRTSLVAAKEPAITAEKAKDMVSRVESIKAAREKNRRQTEVVPASTSAKTNKATIKKAKSFDSAKITDKDERDEVKPASKKPEPVRRTKSTSSQSIPKPKDPVKRSQSNVENEGTKPKTRAFKEPVRRSTSDIEQAKESTKRGTHVLRNSTGSQETSLPTKGKVTLGRAAQVIATDLFIKPGQQMVKDYVVNPTNNLIVKPTNRKIVQPAKGKIEPAAQRAAKVASSVLEPPKVLAQDMGLVRRSEVTAENSLDSNRGSTHTKKPFLHFLKTPQRRNFDDEDLPSPGTQQENANLVATSSA